MMRPILRKTLAAWLALAACSATVTRAENVDLSTVPDRDTVQLTIYNSADGWSKRVRSLKPVDVPLKIQYRYREVEYGPQLARLYLMRNDKQSKLGTTPLPDGTVRVFRDNGRDGLSFVVAQPGLEQILPKTPSKISRHALASGSPATQRTVS